MKMYYGDNSLRVECFTNKMQEPPSNIAMCTPINGSRARFLGVGGLGLAHGFHSVASRHKCWHIWTEKQKTRINDLCENLLHSTHVKKFETLDTLTPWDTFNFSWVRGQVVKELIPGLIFLISALKMSFRKIWYSSYGTMIVCSGDPSFYCPFQPPHPSHSLSILLRRWKPLGKKISSSFFHFLNG